MCSVSLTWEGKHQPAIRDRDTVLQVVEKLGQPSDNKLILGGNREALPLLTGSVDLIYIDPPFNTKKNWKLYTGEVAYSDKWDSDSHYFQVMYEQLILAHRVLKDNGSLYLHCDYRVASHLKLILDEVFGEGHMVNQLIWQGSAGANSGSKKWIKTYDIIFFYVKNKKSYTWNQQYQPHSANNLGNYRHEDDQGRYRWDNVANPGGNGIYYDLGYGERSPSGGYAMTQLNASKMIEEGTLQVRAGRVPRRKTYMKMDEQAFTLQDVGNPRGGGYFYSLGLGEVMPKRGYMMPESTARRWLSEGLLVVAPGQVPRKKGFTNPLGVPRRDIWSDISTSFHKDYPTQKPEKLLERIILASSNSGDTVLDFFCGSGTTLAVAEKLGRRWLGVDSSPIAIEVTKERLKKLGASFEILEVV